MGGGVLLAAGVAVAADFGARDGDFHAAVAFDLPLELLEQAIAGEPLLQQQRDADETVARLISIALRLEGLYRHASTHAAGLVIADRPLVELVPLYRAPRSNMPVTQFNMKWVEPAGLVKFDFLGLKTLTVMETAVRHIR